MRRVAPSLLIAALALAGCVQTPASEIAPASTGEDALGILRWEGDGLVGERDPVPLRRSILDNACWTQAPCDDAPVECRESNCERRAFEAPAGTSAIVVSLRWRALPEPKFDLWLEDDAGAMIARSTHAYPGHLGLALRIDEPAPGNYTAVIAARSGTTDYQAAIRLEPAIASSEPRPLLPNLITLPPTDLTLETPSYTGLSYFATSFPGVREIANTAGIQGCRLDETAEYAHKRCLRFSNAVGNIGEGPLDVSLAAGSMEFAQLIHHSDGTIETHPGGAAEWHATHAHWHNAANNRYTVHPYDPATGTTGEPIGEGKKGGICFADVGLVDVGLPLQRPPAETGWSCIQPTASPDAAWRMGITPGWYDLYPYVLSDQYVDITDLADGNYSLCSVTNGEGTLLEADTDDNMACTPFALEGETVTLLGPEPYHTIPPEGRM